METSEYLHRKLALLDKRPYRRWPRWENDDYIAVKLLLNEVERLSIAFGFLLDEIDRSLTTSGDDCGDENEKG